MSNDSQKVDTLILDAGPLITQPAVRLQQLAFNFFTTPGVYHELRDENVRSKLPLWTDKLKVRQPKPSSIKAVSEFAKLTGDYAVLSMNDVHLLALTYELECDLNGGDGNLRKSPGAQRNKDIETEKEQLSKEASKPTVSKKPEETVPETKTENVVEEDRTPNLVLKQVESEPKSKGEAGDVSTISQRRSPRDKLKMMVGQPFRVRSTFIRRSNVRVVAENIRLQEIWL